jgi:hypothetical protein
MVPTESLDKWKLPEDDLTLIGVVGIKVVYSEPLYICTSPQYLNSCLTLILLLSLSLSLSLSQCNATSLALNIRI